MAEVFHAGELEVPNPIEAVARAQGNLGKALLASSGLGMATGLFSGLLLARGIIPSADSAAITLTAIGALVTAGLGVSLLVTSRRDRRALVIPPDAPGDFQHSQDLQGALENRILQAYRLPDDLLRRLQRWWGKSTVFALPEAHAVARKSLQVAGWCVMGAAVAALGGLSMLSAQLPLGAKLAGTLAAAGTAAALGWIARVRFGLVRLLVTQQAPRCEPEERIATVHGGGDPFVLAADLDQRLMEIRNNRVRNRLAQTGWDGAAAHVSETGRFKAAFFAENQPLNVQGTPSPAALRILALAPGVGLAGGLLMSVHVPFAGPANFVLFLAGVGLTLLGQGFFRDARHLMRKFRWESTALFLDAEGSTGKAEIVAGRASSDSFESKNTVIRSDCKFRWYAGKVVSENGEIAGARSIVAILHDADSHKILSITEAAVDAFRSKGVRVREIEFQDTSPQNILRANVAAVEAKTGVLERVHGGTAAPALKAAKSKRDALAARFCPMCGAGVAQEKAAFCSACGAAL